MLRVVICKHSWQFFNYHFQRLLPSGQLKTGKLVDIVQLRAEEAARAAPTRAGQAAPSSSAALQQGTSRPSKGSERRPFRGRAVNKGKAVAGRAQTAGLATNSHDDGIRGSAIKVCVQQGL